MRSSGQRQLRSRLTWRAAQSRRLTARQRTMGSVRRGIDWARVGTIAAVPAAIGTVLFTGIATYYQAMVSRDQLAQQHEDVEREDREQALLVSYWNDSRSDSVHVLNRSADPIVSIELFIGGVVVYGEGPLAQVPLQLPVLAPCVELIFQWDVVHYKELGDLQRLKVSKYLTGTVESATFYDRDGRRWNRNYAGLWEGTLPKEFGMKETNYYAEIGDEYKEQKAPSCGGGE